MRINDALQKRIREKRRRKKETHDSGAACLLKKPLLLHVTLATVGGTPSPLEKAAFPPNNYAPPERITLNPS